MTLGIDLAGVASSMLEELGTTVTLVRHESNFDYETSRPSPNVAEKHQVRASPPQERRSKDGVPLGQVTTLVAAVGLPFVPDVNRDSIEWNGGEYRLKRSGAIYAQDTLVGYRLEFDL